MKARIRMVKLLWMVHFLAGVAVICLGISSNGGGRKYIPVDAKALSPKCHKAYVNVYATSQDDVDAVICCDGSHSKWSWLTGTYAGGLCVSTPKLIPFARRLTKFPDSWLLPLIPILLRIVTVQFRKLCGSSNSFQSNVSAEHYHGIWVTIRRFISYIVVMNFRGWALYILFNLVQDAIASHFSPGDATAAAESSVADSSSGIDVCWYKHLLHPSKQDDATCYGRRFDFSDHVVLFFGHVLPVVLFEVLFCFLLPFWPQNSNSNEIKKSVTSSAETRRRNMFAFMDHLPTGVIPTVLLLSFVYLNALVFMAVHRTAAYFHTSSEIVVGYLISLLVQIPLGILLWGTQCLGHWDRARALVGLPSYHDSVRED